MQWERYLTKYKTYRPWFAWFLVWCVDIERYVWLERVYRRRFVRQWVMPYEEGWMYAKDPNKVKHDWEKGV